MRDRGCGLAVGPGAWISVRGRDSVTRWCGCGDSGTDRVVGGRARLAVLAGAGVPGADEGRAQALEGARGWGAPGAPRAWGAAAALVAGGATPHRPPEPPGP